MVKASKGSAPQSCCFRSVVMNVCIHLCLCYERITSLEDQVIGVCQECVIGETTNTLRLRTWQSSIGLDDVCCLDEPLLQWKHIEAGLPVWECIRPFHWIHCSRKRYCELYGFPDISNVTIPLFCTGICLKRLIAKVTFRRVKLDGILFMDECRLHFKRYYSLWIDQEPSKTAMLAVADVRTISLSQFEFFKTFENYGVFDFLKRLKGPSLHSCSTKAYSVLEGDYEMLKYLWTSSPAARYHQGNRLIIPAGIVPTFESC